MQSLFVKVMFQSVPTRYINPLAASRNICLSEQIPANWAIFCLIPCPGAKNDGQIPGVGQNFPRNSKKLLLKFAKNPKKLRKLLDNTKFLFGELNKIFIF